MSKSWHGGKGSKQRKGNEESYKEGWDRIFNNKDSKHKEEKWKVKSS